MIKSFAKMEEKKSAL